MSDETVAALISRADERYEMDRLHEALTLYREAIALDPTLAWAFSRIGAILAQTGDQSGAEEALLKALELNPQLPQAHSNLGNLYYARGDYQGALEKYQQAVKLSPETPVYHQNLHAAFKKLGKMSDAISSLKAAHRLEREKAKEQTRTHIARAQQRVKGRFGCSAVITVLLMTTGLVWLSLY